MQFRHFSRRNTLTAIAGIAASVVLLPVFATTAGAATQHYGGHCGAPIDSVEYDAILNWNVNYTKSKGIVTVRLASLYRPKLSSPTDSVTVTLVGDGKKRWTRTILDSASSTSDAMDLINQHKTKIWDDSRELNDTTVKGYQLPKADKFTFTVTVYSQEGSHCTSSKTWG